MKKIESNTSRLKLRKEKITDLLDLKTKNNFGAVNSRPVGPTTTTHSIIICQLNA
jgi:hypothetical protein